MDIAINMSYIEYIILKIKNMMPYYYLTTSSQQFSEGVYPRYGWMMGNWSGGWGWVMFSGMLIFYLLILVLLVLAIVWLAKQIKK